MLDIMQKHKFFAKLKKCKFYKDQIYFLNYIVLVLRIKMEDKQIKVVKNWSKLILVRDI